MIRAIVLDSSPLGLLTRQPNFLAAEECREWLRKQLVSGIRVYIPAIVVYELRRELHRMNSASSLARLHTLLNAQPDRYRPLTDMDLNRAAELWADVRRQGRPTADRFALDIDVILAAQTLSLNLPVDQVVVASDNVGHLSLLVPAKPWREI
jgi:predicted nucleic acid-binding protein